MKLKRLWVGDYKNLKDFEFDFSNTKSCTVIIGNNGSGKSNIIEVIGMIFSCLYYNDYSDFTAEKSNIFDFEIEYNVRDHDIKVIWKDNSFSVHVDNSNFTYSGSEEFRTHAPSQIIAIYSGEEQRLWDQIFSRSYFSFIQSVKQSPVTNWSKLQPMVYLNKYNWDIALLTLLFAEKTEIDKEFSNFRKSVLGINEIASITLKIDLEKQTEWSDNEVVEFVRSLNPKQRTSVTVSVADFVDIYQGSNADFYGLLSAAFMPKKDKLITNILIIFNEDLNVSSLSEGEKKFLLVNTVLRILADNEALLLFDEPDSHLHIKRKQYLADLLLDDKATESEIIVTTHSPTLANSFAGNHLVMLENIDGKATLVSTDNQSVVSELTEGVWNAQEQNIFLSSSNDILLVEGKDDEIYITEALRRLKPTNPRYENLEFEFISMGGAAGLALFVDKFTPKEGQTILALLDRDEAGGKSLKTVFGVAKDEKFFDREVKNNTVIACYPKRHGFSQSASRFEVEDYFLVEKIRHEGVKILQSDNSSNFKDVVNVNKQLKKKLSTLCQGDSFSVNDFDGFKILFDYILDVKQELSTN
ncbi:AAA family ATPase [Photobacterium carnosum]|uniref:ATP-dependent nuclease n=1 Tax=Photobacterium carnosum TaxID=2023717 RepID=UPI001E30A170|nr:ATP-binding protein [Photobacterium carnosum]MCD9543092.1 AAA family ATPase [Photobacterium carnosum]